MSNDVPSPGDDVAAAAESTGDVNEVDDVTHTANDVTSVMSPAPIVDDEVPPPSPGRPSRATKFIDRRTETLISACATLSTSAADDAVILPRDTSDVISKCADSKPVTSPVLRPTKHRDRKLVSLPPRDGRQLGDVSVHRSMLTTVPAITTTTSVDVPRTLTSLLVLRSERPQAEPAAVAEGPRSPAEPGRGPAEGWRDPHDSAEGRHGPFAGPAHSPAEGRRQLHGPAEGRRGPAEGGRGPSAGPAHSPAEGSPCSAAESRLTVTLAESVSQPSSSRNCRLITRAAAAAAALTKPRTGSASDGADDDVPPVMMTVQLPASPRQRRRSSSERSLAEPDAEPATPKRPTSSTVFVLAQLSPVTVQPSSGPARSTPILNNQLKTYCLELTFNI